MDRLVKRAKVAIRKLGVGVPTSMLNHDLIRGINNALVKIGSPRIESVEQKSSLIRAVHALEGAVESDAEEDAA